VKDGEKDVHGTRGRHEQEVLTISSEWATALYPNDCQLCGHGFQKMQNI
jgi:hypothetical protein